MDEHNNSDDLKALRELDPAAGAHASDALRDRVAGIAEGDVAEARSRKRWLVPVAAAAALVVGVGGGYAFGAAGSPAPASTVAAGAGETPIPLITGTADNPGAPINMGNGSGASADLSRGTGDLTAATYQMSISTTSPWYFANNRRFVVPTFDTSASTATVHAIDGRAQFSEADAARIATALGVEGTPEFRDDSMGWRVGEVGARTEFVYMSPDRLGQLGYTSGVLDPWSVCYDELAPQYELAISDIEVSVAYNAAVDLCTANTPMPTEQEARSALSRFLSATGVDESTTVITVESDDTRRTLSAVATWMIDNNTVPVTSSVQVSAAGLLYGNGPTGALISLGEYDIVSPAEAAGRLNDPAFAPTFTSGMWENQFYPEYVPPTEPPVAPEPGRAVPWGITDFTIESARLGLALMTGTDGAVFLAPAYEFTDTDGNMWSVIALAESDLDTTGGGSSFGWWDGFYSFGWGY